MHFEIVRWILPLWNRLNNGWKKILRNQVYISILSRWSQNYLGKGLVFIFSLLVLNNQFVPIFWKTNQKFPLSDPLLKYSWILKKNTYFKPFQYYSNYLYLNNYIYFLLIIYFIFFIFLSYLIFYLFPTYIYTWKLNTVEQS